MFIAYTSRNGNHYTAHNSAAEAVGQLLDSLNGDYQEDFWGSADGQRLERGSRMLDFSMEVYSSKEEAIADLKWLDDEVREELTALIEKL